MTQIKHHIKITTLVFILILTNTAFAADKITNENKNNSFSDAISDANNADHTDGGPAFTSNKDVNTSSCYQQTCNQQSFINHVDSYRQTIQRHHQMQEAQLEAYKRFLENRKHLYSNYPPANNYLPTDIQARREINIKAMDERREAVAERRKAMQLKMYQTNTLSASEDKIELNA
jgi:hypothetical protein